MIRSACLLLALAACKPGVEPAYVAELDAWHQDRLDRLTREDGWLALAGLHWLTEGDNPVGSAASSAVRLPARAASSVGVIRREGMAAHFESVPGVLVEVEGATFAGGALRSDSDGEPTTMVHRRMMFYVISRGDRLGVRVKDPDSQARTAFRGIERYRVDPGWRVESRFEAYQPPRTLDVTTVLGTVEPYPCPGAAVFERDGTSHRLEAVRFDGSHELFFLFADETNRTETYGAGRFLYTDPPDGDRLAVDFNKAYNPPCAFTPYATCPLPPKSNRLALRVTAGEKRYIGASGHH